MDPTRVTVIDSCGFSRDCMVASLSESGELIVSAFGGLSDCDDSPPPDIILIHERRDPFELVARAGTSWPEARIILMLERGDEQAFLDGLASGAHAALPIDISLATLRQVIRALMSDLAVFPVGALENLRRLERPAPSGETLHHDGESALFECLTPRQTRVLRLIARGLSNKAIAQRLEISESTVKAHVRGIMLQTGASSRIQLVARILETAGSVPPAEPC